MFGLMKAGPRLPYCATCKSLGTIYGQRARLLLNHDIAFLAEILLDLAGDPLANPPYRSSNCLTLPRSREEIPVTLEYAAAISVVLAYFRIADHRRDDRRRLRSLKWSLADHAFSRQYRRASQQLRSWHFPLDQMAVMLESQAEREAAAASLDEVMEPTRFATALVFSHGVRLAGRADRAGDAARLGARFGELVYLVDAFEDRERDARRGDFNPLLAFPTRFDSRAAAHREILAIVASLEPQMTPQHAARLRQNVEERLGLRLRVIQKACRESARQRVQAALAFARSLRSRERTGWLKGAAILSSAAAVAFVFPHARRTESWRQCMGVSMNLMALGSTFASRPVNPGQSPTTHFEEARPDNLGGNPITLRPNCCGSCKEMCAETCLEGLIEAICSGCDA